MIDLILICGCIVLTLIVTLQWLRLREYLTLIRRIDGFFIELAGHELGPITRQFWALRCDVLLIVDRDQ